MKLLFRILVLLQILSLASCRSDKRRDIPYSYQEHGFDIPTVRIKRWKVVTYATVMPLVLQKASKPSKRRKKNLKQSAKDKTTDLKNMKSYDFDLPFALFNTKGQLLQKKLTVKHDDRFIVVQIAGKVILPMKALVQIEDDSIRVIYKVDTEHILIK